MKRLSNYMLFIGLIMAFVSMSIGMAYRVGNLSLTLSEKGNLTALYFAGMGFSIVAIGYKLFKEQK